MSVEVFDPLLFDLFAEIWLHEQLAIVCCKVNGVPKFDFDVQYPVQYLICQSTTIFSVDI